MKPLSLDLLQGIVVAYDDGGLTQRPDCSSSRNQQPTTISPPGGVLPQPALLNKALHGHWRTTMMLNSFSNDGRSASMTIKGNCVFG